jgi:ribose/xylose/arabinose/galactoside ABC-type transport system permease subunit
MFDTIFGLPVHPLVVHATVVLVPAAAVAVALAASWPRFRRQAALPTLVLSVIALVLVPLSTQSGESLEQRVGESPLVQRHAEQADGLLPFVIALVVAAAAIWWLQRRAVGTSTGSPGGARRPATPLLALVAVVAAVGVVGTAVQVVRIGHSGAKAAWSGVADQAPSGGGDGD